MIEPPDRYLRDFDVQIIADSVTPKDGRVTTFLLTYPRFIHSELMTHRTFSRNAASSRAIPIKTVIEQVKKNPARPMRWGKNGKGMQDHGIFIGDEERKAEEAWIDAANSAIESAKKLQDLGLHKQIVNRVLEPFTWMTTLVTATEWENFFSLRVHKDAQPEFQKLAHTMLQVYLVSKPVQKKWGEWHIPFGDRMPKEMDIWTKLKIATARAARTSYLTMYGEMNTEKDIALHDALMKNGHWSPFEHACQAILSSKKYGSNLIGWKQYRKIFPKENRKCDLDELLASYEQGICDES